jgi:hypothetical protein
MTCKAATLTALVIAVVLAATALWWSPLNQDEGWYLMAAQRVSEGQLPYRDFAFTQPPLFPLVYQGATPLVKTHGLLAGRMITLSFAILSFIPLSLVIRRLGPQNTVPLGLLLIVLFLGLNPSYLQFSSTVKTYALAGFLLSGAALFRVIGNGRDTGWPFLLCGICCGLAATTRLSLLVFPLPIAIHLVRRWRVTGWKPVILLAAGGVGSILLVMLPFLLQAPEAAWFGLREFHVGRVVENSLSVRAAFLIRWVRNSLPVILGLLMLWPIRKQLSTWSQELLAGSLLVTLIHLTAPFPYDEYQTVLLPVLALVVAGEIPPHLPESRLKTLPGWLLGLALLLTLTSPALESWFGGTRDRIWWPAKPHSDLAGLRQAADRIRELDPGGALILTPDTYLAIETGRNVPPGLEMGPFSYYPDFSTAKAQRLHVLNDQRLHDLIQTTPATVAALSGYGFTIRSPMLTPADPDSATVITSALMNRFTPAGTIEDFGQASTTLSLYTR